MSEADKRTEEGTSESRNYSVTEIISNQANAGWLKVNRYGRIVRRRAISGINNLAICVQNSIKNLSNKNLKLIFLMRIFNILNVKLVPCSNAIRDAFLNRNNFQLSPSFSFGDILFFASTFIHTQVATK